MYMNVHEKLSGFIFYFNPKSDGNHPIAELHVHALQHMHMMYMYMYMYMYMG